MTPCDEVDADEAKKFIIRERGKIWIDDLAKIVKN